MKPEGKISVVIPAFNAAGHIHRALTSVFHQNSDLFFEIIVVDDGSTDSTRQVCESFGSKIRYIYQENQGVSVARNRGVAEANAEIVIFLDSDDVLEPCAVEALSKPFFKDETIGGCSGVVLMIGSSDQDFFRPAQGKYPSGHINLYERSIVDPISTASGVAVRKSSLQRTGGFTPGMRFGEDTELWNKIFAQEEWYFVDTVVAQYIRSLETSVTCRVPLSSHSLDCIWSDSRMKEKVIQQRWSSYRDYKLSFLLNKARRAFHDGLYSYGRSALRAVDVQKNSIKCIKWRVFYSLPRPMWQIARTFLMQSKHLYLSLFDASSG